MEALTLVEDVEWIRVEDDSTAGRVRRAAQALAQQLGFSDHRVGEVGIAATELATNLVRHADSGIIELRVRRTAGIGALELLAIDAGPGVADFDALCVDGHSTAGTLGIGLGAIGRLASRFDIHSVPGRGTVMVATFWPASPPEQPPAIGMLARTMEGEDVCGDVCAARNDGDATTLILVDGLGHGPLAAAASNEALRAFATSSRAERPGELLQRFDAALRATRGAAASVVHLDRGAGTLVFAGAGNVAAWIDDGERRRGLTGSPGIVGAKLRTVREQRADVSPEAVVVLHSDGLSAKWDLARYPGLRLRDPILIAAALLRDAGVRHDDASIVVAKAS